jgi:hypothetical protein
VRQLGLGGARSTESDGFLVSVAAAEVSEVEFKCPQCGGKSEVEGCAKGTGGGGCRGGEQPQNRRLGGVAA